MKVTRISGGRSGRRRRLIIALTGLLGLAYALFLAGCGEAPRGPGRVGPEAEVHVFEGDTFTLILRYQKEVER